METGCTPLKDIDALVFSGGGVRGVSFCGAMMAMRSWNGGHMPKLRYTRGASIGGLFACSVALGLSGERLFRLLDTEAILQGLLPTVDFERLRCTYGLDDGATMRNAVMRVLEVGLEHHGRRAEMAPVLTLLDLEHMTGVQVGLAVTRVASLTSSGSAPVAELFTAVTHPNVFVIDALCMSMSVPLLYCPVTYNDSVYVDGGLLNNAPVSGLCTATTLVLRLQEQPFDTQSGLCGYLSAVMSAPAMWIENAQVESFPNQIMLGSSGVTAFAYGADRSALITAVLDGMACTFQWLARECTTTPILNPLVPLLLS